MSSEDLKDSLFPTRQGTRSSKGSTPLRTELPSVLTLDASRSQIGLPTGKSITAHDSISGEPKNEGEGTTGARSGKPSVASSVEDLQQPVEAAGANWTSGVDAQISVDGQAIKTPVLEASWEAIEKEISTLEEGWMGGWKDDIDTLLVFAGLFSAVVTAFTIESYRWLEEEPEDTTVALLRQISQQMNSSAAPSLLPPFKASTSAVRINVLWFLSLAIALADALCGLLCKQWIRELRRPIRKHSSAHAAAAILLRDSTLRVWHVKLVVSCLPVLLELALFLFFAGLLDLLHTRHPAPFAAVIIVAIAAGLFYLVTTVMPTIDVIGKIFRLAPNVDSRLPEVDNIMTVPVMEDTCPYKSPQAWAVLRSFNWISHHVPGIMRAVYSLCVLCYPPAYDGGLQHGLEDWRKAFSDTIWYSGEWPDILSRLQHSATGFSSSLQELTLLHWFVQAYSGSPMIMPHLRTILESMPLHLVMPAILDQWFYLPDRQWYIGDIDEALRGMYKQTTGIQGHLSYAKEDFLSMRSEKKVLYYRLLHWCHVCTNIEDLLYRNAAHFSYPSPDVHLPFSRIDNLLMVPDSSPDGPHDIGLRLWRIFMEIVRSASHEETCWGALMQDLAQYIISSSPFYTLHGMPAATNSPFVRSEECLEFLNQMHAIALHRDVKLLESHDGAVHWVEATDIVRRVHELPENHFPPIDVPGQFSLSLPALRRTLAFIFPTDSGLDFEYLRTYIDQWGNAKAFNQTELVKILSDHINDHPEWGLQSPDPSTISPLVTSEAGLALVAFVNTRLAEEWAELDIWLGYDGRAAWREALERVKEARPELPPDFFTPILQEEIDPLPPNSTHQPPQDGVETPEAQPNGPTSPGSEDDAGETKDSNDTTRPTTRQDDDEALLNNEDIAIGTEEGIPMVPLAVPDTPENQSNGETRLGGPGADKNV